MLRASMVALGLVGATTAEAYDPPNRDQLWYTNAAYVRLNPLGLIEQFNVGYKRRLEIGDTVLGRDAYIFTGLSLAFAPTYGRVGLFLEAEPVALFRLGVLYQFGGYFGTLGNIASFNSTNVLFSDTELDRLEAAGVTQGTTGHHITAYVQPKFKIGDFAVRNTLTAVWQQLDLPDGDISFYDQTYDRLSPNGAGAMLINDLDVMGFISDGLLGVRYTYSASLFIGDDNDGGDGAIPHHRAGPLFAWTFHDHNERARWDRPTLFFLAQWWLSHPYRGALDRAPGADVHAAIPLVALGLAFEGDLLWKGAPAGRKRGRKRAR